MTVLRSLCGGRIKVQYPDLPTALAALEDVRSDRAHPDYKFTKTEKRAYKCAHCTGWHLTSKKERR